MKISFSWSRLLMLFILLSISGCARIFHKPTLSPDAISIGEIRHRVEQNYLKFQTTKAKARISVESPEMSFMANSTINVKMPDSLYIRLSAGFGFGIGTIFLDQHQFLLHNSIENVVYTASPDSVDLSRFIMIDVDFEELIQAFSGIHLIKPHEKEYLKIDKDQYLLIGEINGMTLKYWVDPKKYVVTKYELNDQNGKTIVRFEYTQLYKKSRVIIPKTIRITQPEQKTRMTIVFTQVDINTRLKAKDFFIKLPDNVEKVML